MESWVWAFPLQRLVQAFDHQERDARIAAKAPKILPIAQREVRKLQQADEPKDEAGTLERAARLEDLHICQMEKLKRTKEE
jgi:ribosomal protein S3AE